MIFTIEVTETTIYVLLPAKNNLTSLSNLSQVRIMVEWSRNVMSLLFRCKLVVCWYDVHEATDTVLRLLN